jgi:hypothetical protein
MNNKVLVRFSGSFPNTPAGNVAFNASGLDELIQFANNIDITEVTNTGEVSELVVDTDYVPEGLTSGAVVTFEEITTRQDVKRRIASRLPRVTLSQGLVLLSTNNDKTQYFINSAVIQTSAGWLRFGIANFTSDQATNPFDPQNGNSNLSAVWGFFDRINP